MFDKRAYINYTLNSVKHKLLKKKVGDYYDTKKLFNS